MVLERDRNETHPRRELLERPVYELAKEERLWVVRHLLGGCKACARIALLSWGLPGLVTGRVESLGERLRNGGSHGRRE
ncbi:MAG TPA: hypothetical protein VF756_25065 [Thermoanaerobaculia bacterium]